MSCSRNGESRLTRRLQKTTMIGAKLFDTAMKALFFFTVLTIILSIALTNGEISEG
jgi:hypothetical protein